jgi:hypothetical protein
MVFKGMAATATFLGMLVAIGLLIWFAIIGFGAAPQLIEDMRRNRWVGVGWALVVGSSFGVWPAWFSLRSIPLTATAILALIAGGALVLWLPERAAR